MRILIATDAFPPICGGSGWSTFELAHGLRSRGHDITIVRPRFEAGGSTRASEQAGYRGLEPIEFRGWAPPVPFVRNYFKNERHYKRFETFLSHIIKNRSIDLIHAQHVLTGPPAIAAARDQRIPSVCTVRDYWPVCYWSDLIHRRNAATLCPGCTAARMTECVQPHAGALWPLTIPMIPYMRSNLSLKRSALARASAVVAVSTTIAADLRARAPELAATRIETIPNPVDVAGIREQASRSPRPLPEPYALYVGKLEPNKGVDGLIAAVQNAQLTGPLVVVGDGSERSTLEAAARQAGRDVRFVGWRPREDVLGWMQHATLLVFPSRGPESLSRVLLEASVLGVPIAAMDTGGTKDIILDEETGLLSRSFDELGDDLARLMQDERLRHRLGDAARVRTERLFNADAVVTRVERLYEELRAPRS